MHRNLHKEDTINYTIMSLSFKTVEVYWGHGFERDTKFNKPMRKKVLCIVRQVITKATKWENLFCFFAKHNNEAGFSHFLQRDI